MIIKSKYNVAYVILLQTYVHAEKSKSTIEVYSHFKVQTCQIRVMDNKLMKLCVKFQTYKIYCF